MPITMSPRVHLPSTWRDAIGKRLTNARIAFYQREGRYGEDARKLAIAKVIRNGSPEPCVCCRSIINISYRRWSYLPKPAHYCAKCLKGFRAEHLREREHHLQWIANVKAEFV